MQSDIYKNEPNPATSRRESGWVRYQMCRLRRLKIKGLHPCGKPQGIRPTCNKRLSCETLLKEYREKCRVNGYPKAYPLIFNMESDETTDVINKTFNNEVISGERTSASEITFYNPTKAFNKNGNKWLALRVEPLENERDSHVMFFKQNGQAWELMTQSPHLHLQDPFFVDNIQGYHILGGVEILDEPNAAGGLNYRTVFYRFKNKISEIDQPFAVGPDGMKDIRLIELINGKIGVFTRPQGGNCGRGKIGYTEIDELDELKSEAIEEAKLIEDQFIEEEWGGVNDLVLLQGGKIGVLGHIAQIVYEEDQPKKNYYAMTFIFDPTTKKATNFKIIATAKDMHFEIKRKNDGMGNIVFSGGLNIQNEKAKLYAGINDTQAVYFEMENPFLFPA